MATTLKFPAPPSSPDAPFATEWAAAGTPAAPGRRRSAVVTGFADRAVGTAVARGFAARGYQVIGIDRDPDAAARTARALRDRGGDVLPLAGDPGTPDGIDAIVAALKRGPAPAHLVCTGGPGYLPPRTGAALTPSRLARPSLAATADLVMAVVKDVMAPAGAGSVVVVTSLAGRPGLGLVGSLPEALANTAVEPLMTAVVSGYGRDVRINAVQHGPFMANGFDRPAYDPAHSPLGVLVTADEVADLVLLLADDAPRCLTGVAVPIDGGVSRTGVVNPAVNPGNYWPTYNAAADKARGRDAA